MRIAFNARVLSDPVLRGWNRYTLNLIAGLSDLGATVFLYSDRAPNASQIARLPMNLVVLRQAPARNYLLWEQAWIPRQCLQDQIDVFQSPIHFGLPQFTQSKCVLTLHDAIDELYYAKARTKQREPVSQYLVRLISSMARFRADHILTVSEHSRRGLLEHFRIPAHKIRQYTKLRTSAFTLRSLQRKSKESGQSISFRNALLFTWGRSSLARISRFYYEL